MDRRTFVMALGAGAAAGLTAGRRARGQEASPAASPTAAGGLPVVRWELRRILSENGTKAPDEPATYWLQFLPDGTVAIQADCNQAAGSYEVGAGGRLTLAELVSTKVACAKGSLGDTYLSSLEHVVSYRLAGDAEDRLVLSLMADGGQLEFAPSVRGVVWQWVSLRAEKGDELRVTDPSRYTLEFLDAGGIRVRADCNRGRGTATIDHDRIELTAATTRKFCGEDSQDTQFLSAIDGAERYAIRGGDLLLTLDDGNVARFRAAVAP